MSQRQQSVVVVAGGVVYVDVAIGDVVDVEEHSSGAHVFVWNRARKTVHTSD